MPSDTNRTNRETADLCQKDDSKIVAIAAVVFLFFLIMGKQNSLLPDKVIYFS